MDALAQMSNYIKSMKEIMSNKKKLDAWGIVSLSEKCSTIIQRKLLEKLKDMRSFTISCVIGEHTFNKALCDLGASINLMPLSVVKKRKLGELMPTTLSLQMADRSLNFPKYIIKDVLVMFDKFIFPIDFVVLDMEEDMEAPLILDRPFLATNKALIDVKNGELKLRVGKDHVKFNLYQSLKFSDDVRAICMRVDSLIPSRDGMTYDFMTKDPLEDCLTRSLSIKELNYEKIASSPELVETILIFKKNEDTIVIEDEKQTLDGLVLKELPKHLHYAFLGSNGTKPMIVSVALNDEMENDLLEVLKKKMRAFSWYIDDIKGISPSICMHKILMESDTKLTIEHQMRLNPAINVVKKEALKWLIVGFIYAISDSTWVSPIQVVPKK